MRDKSPRLLEDMTTAVPTMVVGIAALSVTTVCLAIINARLVASREKLRQQAVIERRGEPHLLDKYQPRDNEDLGQALNRVAKEEQAKHPGKDISSWPGEEQ